MNYIKHVFTLASISFLVLNAMDTTVGVDAVSATTKWRSYQCSGANQNEGLSPWAKVKVLWEHPTDNFKRTSLHDVYQLHSNIPSFIIYNESLIITAANLSNGIFNLSQEKNFSSVRLPFKPDILASTRYAALIVAAKKATKFTEGQAIVYAPAIEKFIELKNFKMSMSDWFTSLSVDNNAEVVARYNMTEQSWDLSDAI